MLDLGTLTVKVKADTSQLEDGFDKAQKQVDEFSDAEKRAGDASTSSEKKIKDSGEAVEDAGKKAKKAGDGFTVFKGIVANIAGNVLSTLGNSIKQNIVASFERVDAMNNFVKVMDNLGFKMKDVKKSSNDIVKSISQLPTTLPEMQQYVQQYASLSGNLKEATNLSIALNDATLAGGQGQEKASAAMDAWYKIIAKGKPEMEQWEILTKTMPAQMKQIAESLLGTGASAQDLFNKWQDGTITTQQVIDAVTRLDKKGGKGMASFKKQAQDATTGIMTSLINLKTALVAGMGDIIAAVGVDTFTAPLKFLGTIIRGIGTTIATVINFLQKHIVILIPILFLLRNTIISLFAVFTANPVMVIIEAIALFIVAIKHLYNTNKDFKNKIDGLWKGIKAAIAPVLTQLDKAFSSLISTLKPLISQLVDIFGPVLEKVLIIDFKMLAVVIKVVSTVLSVVFGVISKVINFLQAHQGILTAIKVVLGIIGVAILALNAPLALIIGVIALIVAKFDAIKSKATEVWNAIIEVLTPIGEKIKAVFMAIVSVVQTVFSTIANVARMAFYAIIIVIVPIINTIIAVVKAILAPIIAIWNALKSATLAAWNGIKNAILTAWSAVVGPVVSIANRIKSTLVSVFNEIKSVTSSVWNGIKNAIVNPIKSAWSTLSSIMSKIRGLFKKPVKLDLKVPHVSVSGGKAPWGIAGKGKVPSFHVNWYAKGGYFDQPTVMSGLGEAGPEYALPLRKSTLAPLAEMLSSMTARENFKQGYSSNEPFVVNTTIELDGKVVARQTAPYMKKEINTIDNRTNRRLGLV